MGIVPLTIHMILALGVRCRQFYNTQEGKAVVGFRGISVIPSIKYIALRYQLVPYVKRLFQMLQETGKTVMRPLYYDFSLSDPFIANATGSNDPSVVHQFMFGNELCCS